MDLLIAFNRGLSPRAHVLVQTLHVAHMCTVVPVSLVPASLAFPDAFFSAPPSPILCYITHVPDSNLSACTPHSSPVPMRSLSPLGYRAQRSSLYTSWGHFLQGWMVQRHLFARTCLIFVIARAHPYESECPVLFLQSFCSLYSYTKPCVHTHAHASAHIRVCLLDDRTCTHLLSVVSKVFLASCCCFLYLRR